MKKRWITTIVAAVLLCALLISGCSQKPAQTDGAQNSETQNEVANSDAKQDQKEQSNEGGAKEVVLCDSFEHNTFAPVLTPESATSNSFIYFGANFYDTLVTYENGEIKPKLAESWDVSEDGKTYTFHLKKDIKFSDGEPFNAEAVKKSYDNIAVNLGAYNGSYGMTSALFEEINAVDEHTVEIKLTKPYYGALKDFTIPMPMSVASPNAFNEDGTYSDLCKTQTLGTGAYKYEGEFDGTTYTFVRNESYWGDAPEADVFKLKVIPDNDAKVLALKNGEIDAIIGMEKLSYDAYEDIGKTDGFETFVTDAIETTRILGLNTAKAPFDDVNVRQAVHYAVDKKAICETLLGGLEEPAKTLLNPSLPYCDVQVKDYGFDVEKAKTLLEEAGWTDSDGDGIREKEGQKLSAELLYMSNYASLDDLSQAIASQLKDVGMEISIKPVDMMVYMTETLQGNYNIALATVYGAMYDPTTFITNMSTSLGSDAIAMQALSQNANGEALLAELSAETDTEKIKEIYSTILNEVNDSATIIPLSYLHELGAYNSEKIKEYKTEGYPTIILVAGFKFH